MHMPGSGSKVRRERTLLADLNPSSATVTTIRRLAIFVTGQPSLEWLKRNSSHPSIPVLSVMWAEAKPGSTLYLTSYPSAHSAVALINLALTKESIRVILGLL